MRRTDPRALIVGAKPQSLGGAVSLEYIHRGHPTSLAGVSGEGSYLNVHEEEAVDIFFESREMFDHVICTVGVNKESHPDQDGWIDRVQQDFMDNVIGPLRVFDAWIANLHVNNVATPTFVFVSSNSAQIARSRSVGYCSSKAALSMASRSLGRYFAQDGISIWAVEPGWIDDTPMSKEVEQRLSPRVAAHRIPSKLGVPRKEIASFIYHTAMNNPSANGCVFRLDGGEQ